MSLDTPPEILKNHDSGGVSSGKGADSQVQKRNSHVHKKCYQNKTLKKYIDFFL